MVLRGDKVNFGFFASQATVNVASPRDSQIVVRSPAG